MKRLFFLVLLVPLLALAREQDEVTLLKWAGPPGSKPDTYEEWLTLHPYTRFNYCLDRVEYGGRAGAVAILTEQSIALSLASQLNQLINNLRREGHTVYSYQISGGTPETLRVFLANLYRNNAIEGALLVGNLPVAWFEIANDFNQYGYAQFPIDLFYMDLDGTWLDTMTTGNGRYDGHEGEVNPEIYVGRLLPTGIGNDTLLLKDYFRRDNAYRFDTLELQHKALNFVDDDWIPWAPQWASDISLLYPDTANYWHAETTRASIYRTKLNTPRAWVAVFAHSSPSLHQFYYNNHSSTDYYYSTEYTSQNPPANFYNHFACSFERYTTSGYGGGRATFTQSYGLGSIGSTKTGSMLEFYYFYEPLSRQKNLGEAFKDWFTYITENGVDFMELCWHYGMTLIADPFLKPTGHIVSVAESPVHPTHHQLFCISSTVTRDRVVIELHPKHGTPLEITAFDRQGRKVRTILSQDNRPDRTKVSWDFTDRFGATLPQGVYLIRIRDGSEMHTRKVVKL